MRCAARSSSPVFFFLDLLFVAMRAVNAMRWGGIKRRFAAIPEEAGNGQRRALC
ncbi:MAG: hypothetical protein Kow0013_27520 [Pararhodobacter sp.]